MTTNGREKQRPPKQSTPFTSGSWYGWCTSIVAVDADADAAESVLIDLRFVLVLARRAMDGVTSAFSMEQSSACLWYGCTRSSGVDGNASPGNGVRRTRTPRFA